MGSITSLLLVKCKCKPMLDLGELVFSQLIPGRQHHTGGGMRINSIFFFFGIRNCLEKLHDFANSPRVDDEQHCNLNKV